MSVPFIAPRPSLVVDRSALSFASDLFRTDRSPASQESATAATHCTMSSVLSPHNALARSHEPLPTAASTAHAAIEVPSFVDIYTEHFAFVWRNVRRLGIAESDVADVTQEIFLVVHRKLAAFEGRSQVKTWLFGIVRKKVSDHRRSLRRKPGHAQATTDDVTEMRSADASQGEAAVAKLDAFRRVNAALDRLDDEKREVLVLAEFEQMTIAEIAEALSANANTIASRLRSARTLFETAIAELEASNDRRDWRQS
jgi:RNA polymerase sigma-70 factor (ECF subfamily)